jgi:8-oxo-dGTP pyrophosphatase MutT (NUDIX family)
VLSCQDEAVTVSIGHVRDQLDLYLQAHPTERDQLAEFAGLLATERPWTNRSHMAGHVTATAIITNPVGKLLLVHHRLHDVFWPPGGHLEPVDESLSAAALREAVEETGLDPARTVLTDPVPLDIEICDVPVNPAKGEGPHRHLDFRYAFTSPGVALQAQASEVYEAAWRPIAELDAPVLVAALRARLSTAA